jgi:hypothetical protein
MQIFQTILPTFVWGVFLLTQGVVYDFFVVPEGETIFKFYFFQEFFLLASLGLLIGVGAVWKIHVSQRLVVCMFFVFIMYTTLLLYGGQKSMISYVIPYHWDYLFFQVDRWLHFGQLPHEYISKTPSFGFIKVMDTLYYVWFFVIYLGVMGHIVFQKSIMTLQKIVLSFSVVWLFMGVYMATIFSSYGPIFWDDFDNYFNPYRDYISHLRSIEDDSLFFTFFYERLLSLQSSVPLVDINGISAMPSLHVALSFLTFLHVPKRLLFLKLGVGLFFLSIFVGSIVLGWHYAVDGYVSILCTYILWRGVNWGIDKYQKRIAVP